MAVQAQATALSFETTQHLGALELAQTAATVLGLAGLALLDRKPEPVEHDNDHVHDDR